MGALFFLAFFGLLGAAVLLGYTVDSRDPDYSLRGVFIAPRPKDVGDR